jgi:hypothetical protein
VLGVPLWLVTGMVLGALPDTAAWERRLFREVDHAVARFATR